MQGETTLIQQAVEDELRRDAYPENFPAIPELPTARYADPAFYDIEMKHFWPKTWLTAAHISELPEVGSYVLFEELGRSIIISRGEDDVVRAFHNVCRHRASAILLEKQGKAKRFICPYHSWGYSAEGQLVSVPEQRDFACLDKSKRGLVPVRCETWRGFVFINLDGEAAPLEEFLAPVARQWANYPLENMVIKGVMRSDMECNWKVAYDNFLEIYHLSSVHGKSLAPFLEWRSFSLSMYKGGHGRFATRKKQGATIFKLDQAPPPSTNELFKEHTLALPTFPNVFVAADPVGFNWQTFWPNGTGKSVMTSRLMGWKDDSDEDRALWDQMKVNIAGILAEDLILFKDIQRNYETGSLPGAMLSYQERMLYWYQEEVDRVIGVENIPEHLRMKQVLADYVAE